jgi:hypothetical protein
MRYALAAAVLLLLPIVAGTAAAGVALAPREPSAAPPFAWVPPGGFEDHFPFGECTWWAAYNRRVSWGGNAGDWLTNAQGEGIATTKAPAVGAIAVYRPGGDYSPLGHVALVTAVTPTTYTVSEMNAAAGHGRVSTRVIGWPDLQVQGFIPLSENEIGRAARARTQPR